MIIDPALDMGEVDGGQMVTYVGVEETAVVSSTEQIHHDHGGVTTTVAVQEVVRDVDGSEIARVVDASGSGPHRVVEYKIIHDSQMSAGAVQDSIYISRVHHVHQLLVYITGTKKTLTLVKA